MIVVMEVEAPDSAAEAVVSHLVQAGADVHRSSGSSRTILGVVGVVGDALAAVLAEMPGVAKVVRVSEPYRLASRRFRQQPSVVDGAWGAIGGDHPWVAVEPIGVGALLAQQGDEVPPSLPYAVRAGRPFDAAVVRSGRAPEYVGALSCLSLDPAAQGAPWPVRFIERPPSATIDDWLVIADKGLSRGDRVVLVETGTPGPGGGRGLDVTLLVAVRAATHLPLIVDVPPVAAERRHVASIAFAAVAAGAAGVILRAWAGPPGGTPAVPATLTWEAAAEMADRLRAIERAVRG
jgi:3-deoxy-7-phosphoheptulonate synthase